MVAGSNDTAHALSRSFARTVVWYFQSTPAAMGHDTSTVAVASPSLTVGLPATVNVGVWPARSPLSSVSSVFALSAGSGWPSPPSSWSSPSPPASVSLPSSPLSMLLPSPPVMLLLRLLPVPSIVCPSAKVRFSRLLPSV